MSVMAFELLFRRYPFGKIDSMTDFTTYTKNAEIGKYEVFYEERMLISPTALDFITRTLVPAWPTMHDEDEKIAVRLSFKQFCDHPFVSGFKRF